MADGDSITNQNGVAGCATQQNSDQAGSDGCIPSPGSVANRYPDQALANISLYSGAIKYVNPAIGGYNCVQKVANAPNVVDVHWSSKRKDSLVSLNCGINDWKQLEQDYNITYGRIVQYVSDRLAVGWHNVIVLTVEDDQTNPTNEVAWQAFRHGLNTLIRNGAAANHYTVMDIAADATMGCDGCASNATYFRDLQHPTVAGYAIFASYLGPIIQGLGFK